MKALLTLPIRIAMMMVQSVWVALGQIWSNKVRSILTTLGIIIGIASVTGVIGSLSGLKATILTDLQTFGMNKIFVSVKRPDSGPMKHASWHMMQFKPEQFDQLMEHCSSVKHFTRITQYRAPLSCGDRSIESAVVVCVDKAWFDIESREILHGRPFSLIDEQQGRRVCLVDPRLRDKLHLDKNCVGSFIIVNGGNYRIIGIIDEKPDMAMIGDGGDGESFEVIIPFQTRFKETKPDFYVVAASKSPDVSEDAKAELSFFLRRTRHQQPGDPDTFRVQTLKSEVEKFNAIMATITAVAGGIVGISLVVGGIGIMNIMLVSVSERTREIGLRKAVGARGSAILSQFLIEAVVLCCTGGALGIGLGFLILQGVRQIPNANLDQAYIPGWAILMSFAFSAFVGIFFGVFPAFKAARLNPIEALRNE